MERLNPLFLISAFIFVLVNLIHSQTAIASDYSYHVDYFRVDGNIPSGLQDDFNDGTLGPTWVPDEGTSDESGGVARLKSPGNIEPWGGTLLEEQTEIGTSQDSGFNIAKGSGDAIATSRWITPIIPTMNQTYMMSVSFPFYPAERDVDFYVGIINADTAISAALSTLYGVPIPTGVSGYFIREISDEVVGIETLDIQIASIDPSLLTESVLLSLLYDDENSEFSAALSFDDGVSSWSPFDEYAIPQITNDIGIGQWYLQVESYTVVPIPAAFPLFSSVLGLFGLIGWRRKTVSKLAFS